MWEDNYDPCYPDQPVVDRYLPMWASLPAFRSKPAFIWAQDSHDPHVRGGHGGAAAARSELLPPPETRTLTYSALETAVSAIASRLRVRLNRGDTVVVLCPPGLRLVKLLFSCQRAGLVMVPVMPPDEPSSFWPPSKQTPRHHHLIRVLSQTRPKAIVAGPGAYVSAVRRALSSAPTAPGVDHPFSLFLPDSGCVVSADELDNEGEYSGAATAGTTVTTRKTMFSDRHYLFEIRPKFVGNQNSSYIGHDPADVYLVQYTSGATGVPKPVLVSAGAAAHNVRAARRAYDLGPSSTIVSWLPQYHDCGLMFLLLTVVAGATCVLSSPAAFLRRPRLWLELVDRYRATCTPVPSFALPLVMRRGRSTAGSGDARPLHLGSLRNLMLVNEPIHAAPVEAFVAMFAPHGLNPSCISPSYGLAENCTFVSTAWRRNCTSIPTYRKLLPSARLAAVAPSEEDEPEEMEIMVVKVEEDACEVVEDGTEGEIWVRSPSNAAGYLSLPSLTAKVFGGRIRGRDDGGGGCFVRTGDRGVVMGEERYLYVLGRASDAMIRPGGAGEVVQYPHYLETAAHGSCPELLRGGCVAAFELRPGSGAVAVVAELQRPVAGSAVLLDAVRLRRLCVGVREAVEKEMEGISGVWVGAVALVERGTVPKTTSGKLRRRAAREALLRGDMPVVYEVDFGEAPSGETPEGGGLAGAGAGNDGDGYNTEAERMVDSRRKSVQSCL